MYLWSETVVLTAMRMLEKEIPKNRTLSVLSYYAIACSIYVRTNILVACSIARSRYREARHLSRHGFAGNRRRPGTYVTTTIAVIHHACVVCGASKPENPLPRWLGGRAYSGCTSRPRVGLTVERGACETSMRYRMQGRLRQQRCR